MNDKKYIYRTQDFFKIKAKTDLSERFMSKLRLMLCLMKKVMFYIKEIKVKHSLRGFG